MAKLTKADEKHLDDALVAYLAKEPKTIWSINAQFELHSEAEVWASVKRMRDAKRVVEIRTFRYGTEWAATALK